MPSLARAKAVATWTPEVLHRTLVNSQKMRLAPRKSDTDWQGALEEELACRKMEHEMIERERAAISSQVRRVPRDPSGFLAWFEELKSSGPGQGDPLFPWLADSASFDDVCWFLHQEMAGEAGFDDLVALTQVRLGARPKLEMARNYWDEMGQGHEGGMHGPMLQRLGACLPPSDAPIVWETLALGNLMVALATHRAYTYQSLGALGAIELTAPGRAEYVNEALKRLHFDGAARRYYALHATLDVRHSQAWNREIFAPLVAEDPELAPLLAEGALMRLRAGARCFERYRAELLP
jgi:hypothetical protein